VKIYVSGKIAGLSEEEFRDSFGRGCALVMTLGDTPVSPLEVPACLSEDCNGVSERLSNSQYLHSWACYLKYDIIAMLECEAIALLPNWPTSKGAKFERYVAEQCGLDVFVIDSDYRGMERIQSGK
jgi:hypothetical protein